MPHGNQKPKPYNKYPKIERKKPNSKKEKKKSKSVVALSLRSTFFMAIMILILIPLDFNKNYIAICRYYSGFKTLKNLTEYATLINLKQRQ